jgi:hypothetical protein
MEKKLTKRNVIEKMLKEEIIVANEDYKNYLENELRLLDNKKAANSTKAQEQKAKMLEIANVIVNALTESAQPLTITEILALPTVSEIKVENDEGQMVSLSNQRVSYILNNDERVNRVVIKKKAYFSAK